MSSDSRREIFSAFIQYIDFVCTLSCTTYYTFTVDVSHQCRDKKYLCGEQQQQRQNKQKGGKGNDKNKYAEERLDIVHLLFPLSILGMTDRAVLQALHFATLLILSQRQKRNRLYCS